MNYEIVAVLRPETDNWQHQKERLTNMDGTLITLAPDPLTAQKMTNEFEQIINVVDWVTKRTYQSGRHLFFNQAPTVADADIFLEPDGQTAIIHQGETIGEIKWLPNSRRDVASIRYFNADGTTDFMEEYTTDGQLFSRLIYYQDQIQQIAFVSDLNQVVLRFHFYETAVNLVTVEDPMTHEIMAKYDNLVAFYKDQVAKIVGAADTVGISYLGQELDVLPSDSMNTLFFEEVPVDENGQVMGNLRAILTNEITSVKTVRMDAKWHAKMAETGLDLGKVIWEA